MYSFKNAIIYKCDFSNIDAETLEAALKAKVFTPRPTMQLSSSGWAPPFQRFEELKEKLAPAFSDVFAINLQTESAVIPTDTVKRAVMEKVEEIERCEARKVRKKERDELKETVMLELMPRALSRYSNTRALLCRSAGLIIVEATSSKAAEELLACLRKSLGSLPARPLMTSFPPRDILTRWVLGNTAVPEEFTLQRSCELHDLESSSPLIRLKDQDITSREVRAHVEGGMVVTKLALRWCDQYEFTLHDDLSIHSLKMTDQYAESIADEEHEDSVAVINADIFRMSAEFQNLLSDLFKAFGGEQMMLKEAS